MNSSTRTFLVCYCNNVAPERVDESIKAGATTLDQIYEACGAGVGPCGGTCRAKIAALLNAAHAPGTESAHSSSVSNWVPPDEVLQAVSLFNRRYYWEAHEVLEGLWLQVEGPEKLFYQGIIQAAATFYHVLNANPQGVIKLAQSSFDKLQKFTPAFQGLPIQNILEALEDFKAQAREILGQSLAGFNYDHLPKISLLEGQSAP